MERVRLEGTHAPTPNLEENLKPTTNPPEPAHQQPQLPAHHQLALQVPERQQSKSPGPHRQNSRGRPRSKTPTNSSSRSNSTAAYIAELDPLAFYSIHSKSPNFKKKASLPTIFRRPLTPNTYNYLKKTYFYKTSGAERFKDVLTKKKCLRCYSSNHRASNCTVFTSPTPVPCRLCVHLFHETQKCPYFDKNGKSRFTTPSQK